MTRSWLEREALITVKAYPNPSAKHHETVCVAAITKEEGWIRLYPVQFRSMPKAKRFAKYQRIQLRMKKHKKDPRPESYRPQEDSFQLLGVVGSESKWSGRWEWIEPTLSRSMCEITQLQQATGKSLGVFRPKIITDFVIEEADSDWGGKQKAALDQLSLFDERTQRLEKIPFTFRYRYTCDDDGCKGHEQSIIDWEIMELFRKVRERSTDEGEITTKIRQKYFDQICGADRDTYLFVGNHSQYPNTFMVLGVFWPPTRERTLFD